ncbi:MAG: squalene synthase HpnC [Gammaproteobacteria bacterium]|nr:squalene synthase HpnC [Gammaproteobacteria bacterium]
MAMRNLNLKAAYRHCVALAAAHYENFPVASRLLPRRLREPIAVIYAFARTADDYADEGDHAPAERLALLDQYRTQLDATLSGAAPADPVFIALRDVITRHALPPQLFRDLLHAFRSDVTTPRYANFDTLLDYCRHSANPVGRLLLHLYGAATPENLQRSDAVCSALQLINFYQDLAQDIDENNRIYIPLDELARFAVSEDDFRVHRDSERLRALLDYQIERARTMMLSGAPLGNVLRGRIGFELRLVIHGGLRVLDRLQQCRDTVFARPRLTRTDWLAIFWKAVVKSN